MTTTVDFPCAVDFWCILKCVKLNFINARCGSLSNRWAFLSICLPAQHVSESFDSLPTGSVFCTLVHYSLPFCSRLETASDVMSRRVVRLIVPDKAVKFRDPRLNRSRESRPKVVGGGIFDIRFVCKCCISELFVQVPDRRRCPAGCRQ